jgi:epoxyqueuosine reductase
MSTFTQIAKGDGKHLRLVPVERLNDLRSYIELFRENNELNESQKRFTGMYRFEVPEDLPFTAKSIIVAAVEHYSYADVLFHLNGKEYKVYSAFIDMYDTSDMGAYLEVALGGLGYHIKEIPMVPGLPQKLLGAQCGLATYGRNNITYIDELGSYFGYATYYSDAPPECDVWFETLPMMDNCETCGACITNCKTGAILSDRYLIDSQKCYSGISSSPGEFPPMPNSAHHSIVRCLKCQYGCPMNAKANKRKYPDVSFDEAETAHILSGAGYDDVSDTFRERALTFGLDKFTASVPRNLKTCFDLIDNGEILTLT